MSTVDADSAVFVYATGLVCCSVCAPSTMPIEEVERQVNAENPTGISSSWSKSSDETFADGVSPNPCPCTTTGPARLHWLLEC